MYENWSYIYDVFILLCCLCLKGGYNKEKKIVYVMNRLILDLLKNFINSY